MKHQGINILTIFRQLIFTLVLLSMLSQPLLKIIDTMLHDNHIEFAQFDGEDESDEKETQENESEDEKIEAKIIHIFGSSSLYFNELSSYTIVPSTCDFSIEIPIPPPEHLS